LKQRRALVTGATGGLGLALCARLAEAGYAVRATGRNTQHEARLTALGAEFVQADLLTGDLDRLCKDIDVVFHAAALSSPWGPHADFQRINVDATAHLLKSARETGVGAFVFVSSPSIYATPRDQLRLTEASPLPARALNSYAGTKRAAEALVLSANAPDFQTTAIRPRALIGPDDTVLLPRIMALAARGRFPIFRGGRALIELTDVRDAATALLLADQKRDATAGQAINISGGTAVAIGDLAVDLGAAMNRKLLLIPIPMPIANIAAALLEYVCSRLANRPEPSLTRYSLATLAYSQTFDLTRARKLLGYEPEHDALVVARRIVARQNAPAG